MVQRFLRRRMLALLSGLTAACAASQLVWAAGQSEYPNKIVRVVVPFPAGSGTDNTARYIAQTITAQTGQSVVVENRPGANGFIAATAVATAPADGYTMLITTNTTHATNASLFK